tara:strand:+ start:1480 stop:1641 length:162 start_codon:yes stop_codon:yes gene_type:complete
MKLTEKQMLEIQAEGRIDKCTKEEKKQIFNFFFGEDYMESDDKGSLKIYKESK